jgi:hypothetical protein
VSKSKTAKQPWRWLEIFPTQAAVLAEWERACGSDFENARSFLSPTTRQSRSHPCTHRFTCGCEHEVVVHGPEHIAGACRCEAGDCPTIRLKPSDLVIYEIDGFKLCEAIRKAFGLEISREPGAWKQPNDFRSVGVFGPERHFAKYICRQDEDSLLNEIERLLWPGDPFLLITPTPRHHSEVIHSKLKRNGCGIIALSETVELLAGGKLKVIKGVDSVLSIIRKPERQREDTTKILTEIHQGVTAVRTDVREIRKGVKTQNEGEPVDESVARQLFALVKQLESETNWRKAPILQVFRLYCMENLSRDEVAKRCSCVPSLISLRLKQIEGKLGRKPLELRQFSSHFEAMEESIADPRAKKIYRRGLTDELSDGEDDN